MPRLFQQPSRAPRLDNLEQTNQGRKASHWRNFIQPFHELLSLISPATITSQLATYSPEAEGAIRAGGRTDLNITHESSVSRLLDILTGRGHLTAPSFAISANQAFPFNGDVSNPRIASLIMNPASHRFDPRINPANLLVNRDAYVSRQRYSPRDVRLQGADLRLTEGSEGLSVADMLAGKSAHDFPGLQKMLSVMASPRFRSFAEYERSPVGARTLGKDTSYDWETAEEALRDAFPSVADKHTLSGGRPSDVEAVLAEARRAYETLLKDSQEKVAELPKSVLDKAAAYEALIKAYSGYAELKTIGDIPLDSKTVSAIMLSPYGELSVGAMNYSPTLRHIRQAAAEKGIRAGTPEELLPAEFGDLYRTRAEQLAKMFVKDPERDVGALPEKYIADWGAGNIRAAAKTGSVSKTYDEVLDTIFRSDAFAGDVASMLTAKDLDAAKTENILKLLKENQK